MDMAAVMDMRRRTMGITDTVAMAAMEMLATDTVAMEDTEMEDMEDTVTAATEVTDMEVTDTAATDTVATDTAATDIMDTIRRRDCEFERSAVLTGGEAGSAALSRRFPWRLGIVSRKAVARGRC